MKVIQISAKKVKPADLKEAIKLLRQGGVIVYPTDTAYGLGADVTNAKAVEKVYRIKGRAFKKPLLIMVGRSNELPQYALVNDKEKKLIAKFWPGPLTLVLKKKSTVPLIVTGGLAKVGIRFPKNKVANLLSKMLKKPITSTSANIAGGSNLYSSKKIIRLFKNRKIQPDLMIDAGTLPKVKPSTIIDLTTRPAKIIRQGPIKISDLQKALNIRLEVAG